MSNIEHLRWLPLDGCFSFFFPSLFSVSSRKPLLIFPTLLHISLFILLCRLFPRTILIKTLSFAQIPAYCIVRKRINDARICISFCTLHINKISQTGLRGIRVVSGGERTDRYQTERAGANVFKISNLLHYSDGAICLSKIFPQNNT